MSEEELRVVESIVFCIFDERIPKCGATLRQLKAKGFVQSRPVDPDSPKPLMLTYAGRVAAAKWGVCVV